MKFEPICLDHAAALIDASPWTVSRDAELLARAQLAAMEAYDLDECIVGVDVYNVEAEAYGCEILRPDGNGVPGHGPPIADELAALRDLSLDPDAGRSRLIFDAAERIRQARPAAKIRIPLAGPFTIATILCGMENTICDAMDDPDEAAAALLHIAGHQVERGRMAIKFGYSLTIYESSVTPPLLSPHLFAETAASAIARMIAEMDPDKDKPQLIIGGNTLPILPTLIRMNPGYLIGPIETDQAKFIDQASAHPAIHVRVNMDPNVFRESNPEEATAEAKRARNLASRHPNASIGTLLPFDAVPDTVRSVQRSLGV